MENAYGNVNETQIWRVWVKKRPFLPPKNASFMARGNALVQTHIYMCIYYENKNTLQL